MSDLNEKELQEKLKKIKEDYPETEFHFKKKLLLYVLGFFGAFALIALGRYASRHFF